MTKKRGLLIAVEGCDRGGKTTQCRLLQEWLKSEFALPSEYIKFPERSTPIGNIINEYLTSETVLSDEAIHLLFSANRWELKDMIEEKLSSGMSLVVDRYAFSGVAYSAAKGLSLSWCKAPDHGLPKPDLVIFLDVPVEGSSSRRGFGEEKYEKVDFQVKVREAFSKLQDDSWMLIDGQGSIDEVTSKIKMAASERISCLLQESTCIQHLSWL